MGEEGIITIDSLRLIRNLTSAMLRISWLGKGRYRYVGGYSGLETMLAAHHI